jgi:hypothetical protein
MFLNMLRHAIPRSWRAAVALVICLLFLSPGLSVLQYLVVPLSNSHISGWQVAKQLILLAIGACAGVAFYYFQGKDGAPKNKYSGLEVLNKAEEFRQQEERLKRTATPVFSSHEGEVKEKKDHENNN